MCRNPSTTRFPTKIHRRSLFSWTSSDVTLDHGLGLMMPVSVDRNIFLSKAFMNSIFSAKNYSQMQKPRNLSKIGSYASVCTNNRFWYHERASSPCNDAPELMRLWWCYYFLIFYAILHLYFIAYICFSLTRLIFLVCLSLHVERSQIFYCNIVTMTYVTVVKLH